MRKTTAICSLLFSLILLALSHAAVAQIGIGISVSFGPPPIPVYEQPVCPGDGYLWTPGFWAYDEEDGYYWVPGTWVEPPEAGFLWTPGYWGWENSAFIFHEGYWGPHVGFYGGINYGFGYGGFGYEGGRWEGEHFFYNTYVNRVNTTIIRNTYNTRVVNITENRVSYNGGDGGIERRPSTEERSYANEHHVGRIPAQEQHIQQAHDNPELRAAVNRGRPPIAATARPADFRSGVVASRQAGGEYKAPPPNAMRGNVPRPGNEARPSGENRPENNNVPRPNAYKHANEVQPHDYTPSNTGNAKADQKYQQQEQKMAAKQAQDHLKLQQQQERQHQQATQRNYNDAQKQQMEQRHAQQTQQMEQRHASQQQHMEQRQAPRQSAPRPENRPSGEKQR